MSLKSTVEVKLEDFVRALKPVREGDETKNEPNLVVMQQLTTLLAVLSGTGAQSGASDAEEDEDE